GYETTPGRALLGEVLPRNPKISFDIVNRLMTKREISNMIDIVYRNCGQKETVIFCDRIMALGFREAFKAGISFGKDDMVVPDSKPRFISETSALAKEYEQQYNDGLITQGEKYNKVVDAWAKCSDKLAEEMMAGISAVRKDKGGRDLPISTRPDCASTRGIGMRAIVDAGTVVATLAIRILGRTAAEDVKDADGKVLVPAGRMIVEEDIPAINAAGVQEVKIRSVLTCEA